MLSRFLHFELSQHHYVAEVTHVREIARLERLRPVPAPAYVLGLIRRRGQWIPVVELRGRLGLPIPPHTLNTCAVVLKLPNAPAAFVVDAAHELLWLDAEAFEPPPPLLTLPVQREYVTGIQQHHEQLFIRLNLLRLLSADEHIQLNQLASLEA